jgi:hypothetical protein
MKPHPRLDVALVPRAGQVGALNESRAKFHLFSVRSFRTMHPPFSFGSKTGVLFL